MRMLMCRQNQQTAKLLSNLRSIRRPYLSTAPAPRRRPQHQKSASIIEQTHLTDYDRDAIDAESKLSLQNLYAAVTQLKFAEATRIDTETALSSSRKRRGGGVLGRWVAGDSINPDEKSEEELVEEGKRDTTKKMRESVIWFLERGIEEANKFQGEMIAVRIQREVERGKSVLHKSAGGRGPVPAFDEQDMSSGNTNGSAGGIGVPLQEFEADERNVAAKSGMDSDQVQLLEKENQDLIKHYENKLDQMRGVEKSMLEISELQTTLSMNLATQSAQIDQLVQDSLSTTENVGTGNKELRKASERKSTARAVFWATCIGCGVAVIWDLLI